MEPLDPLLPVVTSVVPAALPLAAPAVAEVSAPAVLEVSAPAVLVPGAGALAAEDVEEDPEPDEPEPLEAPVEALLPEELDPGLPEAELVEPDPPAPEVLGEAGIGAGDPEAPELVEPDPPAPEVLGEAGLGAGDSDAPEPVPEPELEPGEPEVGALDPLGALGEAEGVVPFRVPLDVLFDVNVTAGTMVATFSCRSTAGDESTSPRTTTNETIEAARISMLSVFLT
jgi:hypothetical protein